jgi:hypothetical protein
MNGEYMKNINYLVVILLCLVPHFIYAGEKETGKKTSPEKRVTFEQEAQEAQQPLINVAARSISSSDGSFLEGEGAMRMQKMLAKPAIPEEEPDVAESESSISVRVDTGTGEAPYVAYLSPHGARRSPRSIAGAVLSPRSGRSSFGSQDDDPSTKQFLDKMREISGKNTRSAKQHFRRLFQQQKIVSGNLQTSIEGEPLTDQLLVSADALGSHSRGGSLAGAQGDVAQEEWLSQSDAPLDKKPELTRERIEYLKKLKEAESHTKKFLTSFVTAYSSQKSSVGEKAAADRKQLLLISREYYAVNETLGGLVKAECTDREDEIIERDLKQAHELGCCAGRCCSSCSPCCVIL